MAAMHNMLLGEIILALGIAFELFVACFSMVLLVICDQDLVTVGLTSVDDFKDVSLLFSGISV